MKVMRSLGIAPDRGHLLLPLALLVACSSLFLANCDGATSPNPNVLTYHVRAALDPKLSLGKRIAVASELTDTELEILQERLPADLYGSIEKDGILLLGEVGNERAIAKLMSLAQTSNKSDKINAYIRWACAGINFRLSEVDIAADPSNEIRLRMRAASHLTGLMRTQLRRRLLSAVYKDRPNWGTLRVLAAVGNEQTAKTLESKPLPGFITQNRTREVIAIEIIRGTLEPYWVASDEYLPLERRIQATRKLTRAEAGSLENELLSRLVGADSALVLDSIRLLGEIGTSEALSRLEGIHDVPGVPAKDLRAAIDNAVFQIRHRCPKRDEKELK